MKYLIIFYFCFTTYSQKDTIIGKAYRNVVDFKNDKPLFESQCIFKKYNGSYKLQILNKKFKRLDQMNIWVISDGKTLYFNAKRHGFESGFIKFNIKGNYYYFYAIPILSVAQRKKLFHSQVLYGLIGSTITYTKKKKRITVWNIMCWILIKELHLF